jgi:cation transport ATPase
MRLGAIAIAIAATFAVANVEASLLTIALLIAPEVLRAAVERRAFASQASDNGAPPNDTITRTTTFASRAALSVTSAALVGSVVLLVAGHPISSAVALLIVAGSAGMTSAAFIPMRAAFNWARRRGAIIEDGAHLEALWSADAVAIDVDETVTLGELVVRAVYPTADVSLQEVLQAGAAAESRCEHPIAHAIVRYALEKNLSIPVSGRCTLTPGQGVRAFVDGQETVVGNSEYVTAGRMPDRPTTSGAPRPCSSCGAGGTWGQ